MESNENEYDTWICIWTSTASEWQIQVWHKFKFDIRFIQQDNLFIDL